MTVTRTYGVKLKPNKSQREQLNQYFYEAKVLYNYLLNCSNIFAVHSCKVKHVWKFDKDKNKVPVVLESLPAKLRQNVHRSMIDSIKSLSASKAKGRSIGRLKFKSEVVSIDFDNQCYSIVDSKHLKLAGFGRQKIRACGLYQFNDVKKFRNAHLLKKDNNFYLNICVLKEIQNHQLTGKNVGIDLGVESSATLSTGEKTSCKIEETVRLKRLQKKYARSLRINGKRTNNSAKILDQIHKEYQKLTNRKMDKVHKLIHYLDSNFDHICFQDEQIAGWKNLKSCRKTIQHSYLGTIKTKLQEKNQEQPDRYIMHNKWTPTTQYCPLCGQKNKHNLDQRMYHCFCGYTEDRDVHAAKNMLIFAGLTA